MDQQDEVPQPISQLPDRSPPLPPEPPQPKLNLFLILVVATGMMAVGLGGGYYYALLTGTQKESIIEPTTIQPSISPVTSTSKPVIITYVKDSITPGYKTYTNTRYQYELTFPDRLYVSAPSDQDYIMLHNYDPETAPGREYDPSLDQDIFKITFSKWMEQTRQYNTIDDLKRVLKQDGSEELYREDQPGIFHVEDEKIIKSTDTTFLLRQTYNSVDPDTKTIEAYTLLGNGDVIVGRVNLDAVSGRAVFEEILSTFIFIQ